MIRISLFWRTFVLIAGLVAISLATLLLLLRFVDSAPPEQRLAWEVASIVNLTRSALVSSQPERRITLLRELANEEGIRVLPLEPTDEIELSQQTGRVALLAPRLQNLLGPQTLVVPRVNKQDGLWISFNIDADKYWLQMQSRRIDRHFGPSFGTIASLVAGLALLGSLALSRLVNKPLADLSRAISALRRGERPARLNENLASTAARSTDEFNAMTADLLELEQDRARRWRDLARHPQPCTDADGGRDNRACWTRTPGNPSSRISSGSTPSSVASSISRANPSDPRRRNGCQRGAGRTAAGLQPGAGRGTGARDRARQAGCPGSATATTWSARSTT
ncbi:MAG: hypothetical protein R3E68_17780 [Burkholderiaceae bacterium]